MRPLIRHLRESGQLTAGLVLRALLSGNIDLFEEALAELSGLPLARVSALVHDQGGAGFRALYRPGRAAGLDLSGVPRGDRGDARGRLHRRAGRRDAAQAAHGRARADALRRRADVGDVEPLLTLLRRFATEAAREEARLFCDELVGERRLERTRAAPDARGDPQSRHVRSTIIANDQACAESSPCAFGPTIARLESALASRRRERRGEDAVEIVGPVAVLVRAGTPRSPRAAAGSARSAIVVGVGRAFSRMMARMASTCWSTRSSGMRVMSGVCSISRHRLSASARDQRKAEGRGLALDVVGGVEQARRAVCLVKPLAFDLAARARRAARIPSSIQVENSADELRQRLLGARDRIVVAVARRAVDTALRSLFGGVITSWSA